ncbi:hypothetical protein [Flavobacterium oreochromis]|uniref:Uncharacterized protein n=2 Tax=Flavobacterium TaxID=237 RepID=A0A246G7N4_9FLAO|nr:hypothetical protein [Flavobacterium oreochromis]OWP74554.1 hypothetical protein BWK62_14025 [Flavobacterium oreochromis]OWP75522.1 hypothetical protein BWG23_10805 [Flavobacterium oreochromis]POR26117.1 hypothetical protein BWK58_05635 [Flavobacterium columnare]
MKRVIYVSIFVLLTGFSKKETNVFICGSKGAKKYHYGEDCRGLNACKHEIIKISLREANEYGLTLCGWED